VNVFRRLVWLVWLPCLALLAAPRITSSLVLAGVADAAPEDSPAQIRFTYENARLQPAKYVLIIHADGSGHYSSEPGTAPLEQGQSWPTRPEDREIAISKSTRDALFSAARQARYFSGSCDDGGDKIAFQGKKTLEYEGPDGRGSCTYNWSTSKQIQLITSKSESIALTLEEGQKLQTQHEHARLSLDPELEFLDHMVREGSALELENIAPVLSAIAADDEVLQRARRRASSLLDMAKGE
jgi:hypothetical protein